MKDDDGMLFLGMRSEINKKENFGGACSLLGWQLALSI